MQVGRCLFAQCPARTRSLRKGQGALPEGCANDACSVYKQANTEVCACALADATKQTRPAQGGCRGPEAGVRLCLMLPAEAV